jgi:hypothetical protein
VDGLRPVPPPPQSLRGHGPNVPRGVLPVLARGRRLGLDADPAAVTTADVNAFVDKLVASGFAATTISITWRNLRPFFSWWAKETGNPNPFAGADVPSVADDKPPPVIDLDDVRALLATCSGPAVRGPPRRRDHPRAVRHGLPPRRARRPPRRRLRPAPGSPHGLGQDRHPRREPVGVDGGGARPVPASTRAAPAQRA